MERIANVDQAIAAENDPERKKFLKGYLKEVEAFKEECDEMEKRGGIPQKWAGEARNIRSAHARLTAGEPLGRPGPVVVDLLAGERDGGV